MLIEPPDGSSEDANRVKSRRRDAVSAGSGEAPSAPGQEETGKTTASKKNAGRKNSSGGGDASGKTASGDKPLHKSQNKSSSGGVRRGGERRKAERYAAIDLGTNNCRLLIAAPKGRELRIVDAYSCIVRLGEGLAATGRLSEPAIERAIEALKTCAEKISRRDASHVRCIATQACRGASNGPAFLERVAAETGLVFDIITPEEEARLAVQGCADLLDADSDAGLVFDIGGGSVELSWVRPAGKDAPGRDVEMAACISLPFGVVSLAEEWGGGDLSEAAYGKLIESIRADIAAIGDPAGMRETFARGAAHYLGTSGTITSVAGVHLGLQQYRRDRVDGLWLSAEEVRAVARKLQQMSFEERASEPCIGRARADLVVCGCAILEALLIEWPAQRVRVADRGLREGVLADLAAQAKRERRRRSRRRGGRRSGKKKD